MGPNESVTGAASPAEVREALEELQRYLSDELAPLMVSDSIETLIGCPPALVVQAIKGWTGAQVGRPGENVTVGDYLFHSLKKLHQMIEYELIDAKTMTAYLGMVGRLVLELCPEAERATLEDNLARLGDVAVGGHVSSVEILHRQPGARSAAPAAPAAAATAGAPAVQPVSTGLPDTPPVPVVPERPVDNAALERGMRRLSLMLEHLGRTEGSAGTEASERLGSYALATAATHSRDNREFSQYLKQLEKTGLEGGMPEVFRSLGQGLPAWEVGGEKDLPASASERAMQRIMSMAEDSGDGMQRSTEMLQAAVEHFNEGALIQASKMMTLAHDALQRMKLDPEVVRGVLRRTAENLSRERLREFAEQPERHRVLSELMGLFPAYTVGGLLESLAVEERRDQRRMMLSLLEAHGQATRQECLERLRACTDGSVEDPFGYFQRNLVFLLRRIPPPEGVSREAEMCCYIELSGLDRPMLVARESIGALSQIKDPRAEQTLATRMEEIETALVDTNEGAPVDELRGLLDRIAAGLARQATPTATRALIKHAFDRRPAIGNSLGRLEELSGNDLSDDAEIVELLLKALKREVPMKVLGFVVPKNQTSIVHLARALGHTPTPAVKQELQRIASGYPGQDFAREIETILAGFEAMALPAQRTESHRGLSGDVELFGLPNLLQSLSESRVTGTLTLRTPADEVFAKVELRRGKIHSCDNGRLQGEDAFYQLFEMPSPGTFDFRPDEDAPEMTDHPPLLEVQNGLLEALRRYDEFQMSRAVAPDDVRLQATGQKPTTMEGESDVEFLRGVWSQASKGTTPSACESSLPVDAYRVRRLYAHWLESGALQRAAGADEPAAPPPV